jgi:hypothetical protein
MMRLGSLALAVAYFFSQSRATETVVETPVKTRVEWSVNYDGAKLSIMAERLHGETWLDVAFRIAQRFAFIDRAADRAGAGLCARDVYCLGQQVEHDLLLALGCREGGMAPFVVAHSEHGHVVACGGDPFCAWALKGTSDVDAADVASGRVIVTASPETASCKAARTERHRYPFYVVSQAEATTETTATSKPGAGGRERAVSPRRRFLAYQMARWMAPEDAAGAEWVTAEPSSANVSALRRTTGESSGEPAGLMTRAG